VYKASKEELTSLLEPAAGEENRSKKSFWSDRKHSSHNYAMLGLLSGLTNHSGCMQELFFG
jgi:hypothetical protein